MQLVVCEKPSVGATLAKALGAADHKNGYIEGDNIIVSWCIGHLVELASADCYDERYKKWNIDDLPIIPQEWQFIVSAGKNEQFEVLRSLMNDSRVTEVVNACDAGREGELIFRLVYNKIGCTKPIKRLWLSSMEEKAIVTGFSDLKDGKEYDNLYRSALCRSKADWIVGINSTRLFSKMYNKKLNVGRVQTPTLAILLDREKAIADFQKEKYYTVKLKTDGLDAVSEKITDNGEAKRIAGECGGKTATVKSVKTERKTVNPPKLYDLTTLQRDANRLYGYTAQQTLDYTQSLYEMKLCTYPRTDSSFLTDDMGETAEKTAETVMKSLPIFEGIDFAQDTTKLLNSAKVSDHTAIIPTLSVGSIYLSEVPNGEKNILFLIACRLLCATSTPYIYDTVTAEIECNGISFTAKGRTVISEGFKAIENAFKQKQKCKDESADNAEEPALSLTEGQTIMGVSSDVCENYTQPPKHFTEDTLLSAMERAGTENITEEVERSGLGTPATRASIIEKLTKSGFVTRDKRNLLVSAGGSDLISFMPEIIKSAKLTADWENKLSLMAQGKFTEQQFMADIERLVCDIIAQARSEYDESKVASFSGEAFGTCPRCGRNILKTPKAYSCENKACGFAIWKQNKFFQNARKELTDDMVKKMLSKGKVAVSGLYSQKSGKTYDAVISLDDTGKYVNFKLEFPAKKTGKKGR
ncbi:MAG: DNA topoisomerase 3 [Ruminiclostridium sp.]|nr:DNA topoisomerase 3 [Ruminiclostridium sp.]